MSSYISPRMAVELCGISKTFGIGESPLYEDFSLAIESGTSTAIVGPSGCGKSTLLNVIALAEPIDSGDIRIAGENRTVSHVGTLSLAYIFQRDALLPWATVLDNVLLGVSCKGPVTESLTQRATDYLDRVGLRGYAHRYPDTLSGGQRQLVAIIQNLLIEPEILILDEPFAHLDFQTKLLLEGELLNALKLARSSSKRRTTLMLVTHDIEEAIVMADRVVVVGRENRGPMKIALDLNVAIPYAERDPVATRECHQMRLLFHKAWGAIKSYVGLEVGAAIL